MPTYSAYGLVIRSDIPLPALAEVDARGFDIDITAAAIPLNSGGENKFRNWEAEPNRFLSHFFNVGRILVTDGNAIAYDREGGVDDSQIISLLLGTGLAAAMMQRRMLPIHSCAVLTDKGVVMVMGRSGAGKSTMLGGLLELGLPMLADDVTGLDIGADGRPMAIAGFPAMRLWEDSLTKLGQKSDGLPKVRNDLNKYYLPVANFHPDPEPIRCIVHLTASNEAETRIEEIDPARRLEVLSRFIFRKNFIDGLGLRRFAFERVAHTVNNVRMLRVTRPAADVKPQQLARYMLDRIDADDLAAAQ